MKYLPLFIKTTLIDSFNDEYAQSRINTENPDIYNKFMVLDKWH